MLDKHLSIIFLYYKLDRVMEIFLVNNAVFIYANYFHIS